MTKLGEFDIGCEIIKMFCDSNTIEMPKIVVSNSISGLGYYDFSQPDTIFINLKNCNRTSKKNHPGMIYESTVLGTMLHEFGHYLHFRHFPALTKSWDKIANEPHTKYHQMEVHEDIAECIRLFIINPTRMLFGRPKRCKQLMEIFEMNVNYCTYGLLKLYDEKHEKIDMDKWELFLV